MLFPGTKLQIALLTSVHMLSQNSFNLWQTNKETTENKYCRKHSDDWKLLNNEGKHFFLQKSKLYSFFNFKEQEHQLHLNYFADQQ